MIDESKTRITISLDKDVEDAAQKRAGSLRTSISRLINWMLADALGFGPNRDLHPRLPEGNEEKET